MNATHHWDERVESVFDFVVIGGGTSGAIIAARLSENTDLNVCLIEAGPSDQQDARVLELKNWPNLLRTELDFDYLIEAQARGNGTIRHSRGRVLGGCSSHNSAIAFRAPAIDMKIWEESGADGWGPEGTRIHFDRVIEKIGLETIQPLNECAAAFVEAAQQAGFPRVEFNSHELNEGVGWFQLNKKGPLRRSSSVAYLHPLLDQGKPNLTLLTDTSVYRLVSDGKSNISRIETSRGLIRADREVILCAGAFDSPKLLLLSGIGPQEHLDELGIKVMLDLPGVGENLLDHPEGVVMWESSRPVPSISTQFWETGLFVRTAPSVEWADLMFHFGTVPFDMNTVPLGFPTATEAFCMTPNVARAKSQGTVRLRSNDPKIAPQIDPKYFTDPDGHDEKVMLAGIHLARKIADQPAMKAWIRRELAPGPGLKTDEELSEYARRTANTVYHPAGTCRMGAVDDPLSVVDSQLRVKGMRNLRVADASIFPTMIGVNPCITCMMIGEKCADSILQEIQSQV
jgi:choline oxidase